MMEESVWKYACLRDLQVPDPGRVEFKWIELYASVFGETSDSLKLHQIWQMEIYCLVMSDS